jgi:DNA-binding NtrC family response regulator
VPPLRERRDDVPLLVQHFLERLNADQTRKIDGITEAALERLADHDWPGNVRELENLVERMVVMRGAGTLDLADLPAPFRSGAASTDPAGSEPGGDFNTVVDRLEAKLILEALDKTGGNKNQAARLLGLNRTTLIEKIKKKGLEPRVAARDASSPALREVR